MRLPPVAELQRQALDALIDERVMITTARESGMRVDEIDLDRAVQNIAQQNQLTLDVLRQRLRAEGIDYARFRANLRDQIMIERCASARSTSASASPTKTSTRSWPSSVQLPMWPRRLNIAQILVTLPEGANPSVEAERRARAEAALARVRGGEAFDAVARQVSEDSNRAQGGEIGLRPASRLPDLHL
jgi:peptidyl-prolyl cis-trans isomerase SurA